MKITIESTEEVTSYNGAPVRVWAGTTERGTPCRLYIAGLRVNRHADCAEFERELKETAPPPEQAAVTSFDARLVID